MRDLFALAQKPRARDPATNSPGAGAPEPPAKTLDMRDHPCAVCGDIACFGFGVSILYGRPGRWSCLEHRAIVEAMR